MASAVKVYFLIWLITCSSFAYANELPTDNYYKTKMLCSSTMIERYKQLGRIWFSSFSQTGLLPLAIEAVSKKQFNQFKFGEEFRNLIDDPQHFKAVQECFGSDDEALTFFFLGIYAADVSAKFAAWATDALMLRVLWYGAQAVWAAGGAEMPQRYMWFRVITRLANKDRTFLRKLGHPFILIALLTSFVSTIVVGADIDQKIILNEREAEDKQLQESVKDLEALQVLLKSTRDKNEINVIRTMIIKQLELIKKLKSRYTSGLQ